MLLGCLAAGQWEDVTARFEDAVGTRISSWAATRFRDELEAALELLPGSVRDLDDRDWQIFLTWFCSDRELMGGGTPVERYAVRPDLDEREEAAARRIARARLSLQRVRAVVAGRWIELEDVLGGEVVRVRSGKVSREAARGDVLLCRVVEDDPPSLWGPVMLYAPDEERELIAEVRRLASALGIATDADDGRRVIEVAALELMRFVPPRRCHLLDGRGRSGRRRAGPLACERGRDSARSTRLTPPAARVGRRGGGARWRDPSVDHRACVGGCAPRIASQGCGGSRE